MKKNQKFSDLLYNNKFLLVFSVVMAVAIWLVVAVELAPETEIVVKNVPVQIDYSKIQEKLGLEPFGETKFTVDVVISGKRYVVESDDIGDDIIVTANIGYVNSVGTYRLALDVGTESARPDFRIVSASSDEIEVYFDYPKEKEFVVQASVEFENGEIPDGYYLGDYIFPETDTVRVSGPETEVNKISRVIARATVDGTLRQSKTLDASLVALTREGSSPKYISFNRQSEMIQITLPVYKIAKLPVTCSFINKPSDYIESLPFTVSISPASARFGVPESKLEGMKSFEIASIDFSNLKSGVNTFTIKSADITGGVILDGTEEFTVTVNVSGMSSGTIAAPSTVGFINVPGGASVEFVKLDFSEITVIGPQASIAQLNSDNITLSADLNGIDDSTIGEITVPVTLTDNDCWSYGTYTATVRITQ
ncbi:MAG: CdaR family protein [Clostridiaceae bacterium]|nr:CdaR family protein [Clostridiaceae bacterium]